MSKLRQIIKLYTQGWGKKKIALRLSVSKNTVRHYIAYYGKLKTTYQDLAGLSDLELNNPFHPVKDKPPAERLQMLYELFPDVEKQLRLGA